MINTNPAPDPDETSRNVRREADADTTVIRRRWMTGQGAPINVRLLTPKEDILPQAHHLRRLEISATPDLVLIASGLARPVRMLGPITMAEDHTRRRPGDPLRFTGWVPAGRAWADAITREPLQSRVVELAGWLVELASHVDEWPIDLLLEQEHGFEVEWHRLIDDAAKTAVDQRER